jgi:protein involved in polysaccharide export with SLBB domain
MIARAQPPQLLADKAANAPAAVVRPQPQTMKDGRYLLQMGDQLAIKVLDVPDLNAEVTIGPDGRVGVLMLGDIEAAGLTVEELRKRLSDRYAQEYREPQVALNVKSFASLKVFIGGEVEHPGMIPLNGEVSALSAIFQSGGFKSTAKTDNVILIRNDGLDRPIAMKMNLKRAWKDGTSDVALQPFDVVYVPMSKIGRVDQIIDQYIRKVLPITLNGGFNYLLGNTGSSVIRFQ